MKEDQIKDVKVMAGQFYEEVKSNNLTDFIIWLDCKYTLSNQREKEMRQHI